MSDRIDRRSFLARGAATGAGIAAIGTSGGLLSACGSGSGPRSGSGTHPNGISTALPKRGGKVILGTEAENKGFNPTTGTFAAAGYLYARTVFDPLAAVAADGTVKPYLAQSLTPNADYTQWAITLRPNLVFHDETPCDAAALYANFDAHKHSALTGPALTNIKSIAVTDPMTVTVTMHLPWVPFDYYLANQQVAYVVAPSMLNAPHGGTANPVGTGPFVFDEWVQNSHFTAHRNPHYWRPGLPHLDTIEYRPIPDSQQLLNSLVSNSVDVVISSSTVVTMGIRANPSFGYLDDSQKVAGEPDMSCLILNLSAPPFDNPDVRKASAMAISSAQYVKVISKDIQPTSNGPFVEGTPYFASDGYPAADPTKAKLLISKVQRQTGKPISLTINHVPDTYTTQIAEYLQEELITVGMHVTLDPVQQDALIDDALLGKFQAQVWRQFGAVDPDLNYIFWSPTQIGPGFSINMARNSEPAMEVALQKGRQSPDPATRAAAYQEVASLMGRDIPYLWTGRTVWSVGAQPKVRNFANPTLPSGGGAFALTAGVIWPTQIWLDS